MPGESGPSLGPEAVTISLQITGLAAETPFSGSRAGLDSLGQSAPRMHCRLRACDKFHIDQRPSTACTSCDHQALQSQIKFHHRRRRKYINPGVCLLLIWGSKQVLVLPELTALPASAAVCRSISYCSTFSSSAAVLDVRKSGSLDCL